MFSVPLPRSVAEEPHISIVATLPTCPRCGTEVTATATYCHKCHTDLTTGRRLPLKQRLRLLSWRSRVIAGVGLAAVLLAAFFAVQLYRIRSRPAGEGFSATSPREIAAEELARKLLSANNPAERLAALDALRGLEARAASALVAALGASLTETTPGPQAANNRIAAIDLLARSGEAHASAVPQWLELLERCQKDPALSEAAIRARALLGDSRVANELGDIWFDHLQRELAFSRIMRVAGSADQPAASFVLRHAAADVKRAAEGLRALARNEQTPVFEHLAEAYWQSWAWLGQARGDRLAEAVFELAKPAGQTLASKSGDAQQPGDVLKRVAERGSPAARAAVGLILEPRGPQYKTLCQNIAGTLANLLPDCAPVDQQRLTWAIARLRGKLFGNESRNDPREVTAEELRAALEWAHPGTPAVLKGPFSEPPLLAYRVTTAARQLERDLLRELERGWPATNAVLVQWRTAELGCTPRVWALLDPGRRRPDYAGLTAAMIIVAETQEQSARPLLELWREASDRPAWVRALAYTVLGSLDGQRGRWDSGWPAGLDLGNTAVLDAGQPGWEHFGRVLAAGGPAMLRRLREFKPNPLSTAAQTTLQEAAQRCR